MRVLIADDDSLSCRVLQEYLLQWGYDVMIAHDGNEAWLALQAEDSPKLAILDWMMPGMDGLQLCRNLRNCIHADYVYVLLLTAKTQKEDLLAGLEAGADDYLSKPFDSEELRFRLRAGRRIVELQEHLLATQRAVTLSMTHDPLTGIWTRQSILGTLRQKLTMNRDEFTIGVILVEVKRLNEINRSHGPRAGDTVLRAVAARIRCELAAPDYMGRYTGSEFMIVLTCQKARQILERAQRLRTCIVGEPIDALTCTIDVTANVRVAAIEPVDNVDTDSILRTLDPVWRPDWEPGAADVELLGVTPARIERNSDSVTTP
jgi:diguanylate cyclase (GGDEF)-like protein